MDTGGKIRTGKILEQLSKTNEITLISNVEPPKDSPYLPEVKRLCSRFVPVYWKEIPKYSLLFFLRLFFQMFSLYPVSALNDTSRNLKQVFEAEYRAQKFDVVICDFIQSALNFRNIKGTPSILFQHNVESQISKRHYDSASGLVGKLFWWFQWKKLFFFEQMMCRRFDTVLAVSVQDRELFRVLYGLDNVVTIPTGVDIAYFHPQEVPQEPGSLVFVGSMDWLPNEEAIMYFAKSMLPHLKKEIPEIQLIVVGRNPSPRLQKLLSTVPEIQLTGWVEDVRPYIAKAALYIVPIRIGGGTRMKIYEAMAMGKSIISTSIGAEGLSVVDGENILLEDNPTVFCQKILGLINNKKQNQILGDNASIFVRKNYSWSQVGLIFQQICTRTASCNN